MHLIAFFLLLLLPSGLKRHTLLCLDFPFKTIRKGNTVRLDKVLQTKKGLCIMGFFIGLFVKSAYFSEINFTNFFKFHFSLNFTNYKIREI